MFVDTIFEFESLEKIERKMEQFKVCERETKTKAYSREGNEFIFIVCNFFIFKC